MIQSSVKTFITIDYYIHKTFIAANLCENKDKMELQCEGKCHLKKQLDKQEQKEEKLPNILKEKSEIAFFKTIEPISFAKGSEISNLTQDQFLKPYKTSLNSVFHPPPVI